MTGPTLRNHRSAVAASHSQILVVDDQKYWRDTLADILTIDGHVVDVATDREGAIKCLQSKQYSLVITDIRLEDEDPSHIAFQMICRTANKQPETRIIAVSGAELEPEFMFYLRTQQGIDEFVSKITLSVPAFRQKVAALLNGSQQPASGLADREPGPYAQKTITILFAAAEPTDIARLRTGREFDKIKAELDESPLREQIALLNPLFAVQPKTLAASILRSRPTVVHFTGHGTGEGYLCFETEDGSVQLVAPTDLADLFRLLADTVKCVVLNACNSSIQAQPIARHIDYVIGIDSEIEEVAAIEFAVAFYQGLGSGLAFTEAHEWACGVMRLSYPNSPKPQRVLG